ncbi:PREDICTED: coiled-coil domain-containing protein 93 isoform X3 [Tarenaya hassleriana]|uniref:coiled-coil domain-containing protein 93 isoform X3 n=1 Tax=Tarenaya hassleriana TaxID=28532 RepID=UPI00053C9898|nr:PREDICTED: coiled-coil domain-containing protein 93 isoform X3 [Tarenaya hassleriana]
MVDEENSRDEVYPSCDDERSLGQLEEKMNILKTSVRELSDKVNEQNQRKCSVQNELQQLRERLRAKGDDVVVEKLVTLLKALKVLKTQESEFMSNCEAQRSALEAVVVHLEEKDVKGFNSDSLEDDLNEYLVESLNRLTLAKKELAGKLREIIFLKRRLDDVPCQSELVQYERRFSELNLSIQEKLQQTRKLYATYNALLEIKELMLKETSLLNSISSQFQDVIASPVGPVKLIDSMEGVMKGIQQKLEKVQIRLQEKQKLRDTLKEKYASVVAEQRQCYSVLRAFQEECAKNERLSSQKSAIETSEPKGVTE